MISRLTYVSTLGYVVGQPHYVNYTSKLGRTWKGLIVAVLMSHSVQ